MQSSYLPDSFDDKKGIVLIAGKFEYPVLLATRIRSFGIPLKIIGFKGETSTDLLDSFPENDRAVIRVGQLGKLLKLLRKFEFGYTLMAGQITPGRLFRGLFPDLKALSILKNLDTKNAETIFGTICSEIESLGIQPLDARSFMDEDLATQGMMQGSSLNVPEKTLEHGVQITKEIAKLDIGQGAVVRNGTVISVEGFEGTNEMIQRSGTLSKDDMLFVKCVKNIQDYRFDVPVFGEETLKYLDEANIRNIALEANKVIMLNKEQLLSTAKKMKMKIIGFS